MPQNTELLLGIRRMIRLYETMIRQVCAQYGDRKSVV